jgi:hypothetical protein
MATRTPEEMLAHRNEYQSDYRAVPEHKTTQQEYQKEYRINNSWKYVIYDCSCGGRYSHSNITIHNKSNKHRAYVVANATPDEIIKYNNQYPPYKMVLCDCGASISERCLSVHLTAKTHKTKLAAKQKSNSD